ncbi:AbrB family transcriptional regulator [Labrenzia sp. OB1]|uniref:AbrB family transcriptional regulator n=1 Tax=Labrenzia sp. OB1 TaxID=1561204 RepID=UPI000B0807A3|nr:AbrB family transcriptional regulator [Labrenzia sp. OB1]
MGSKLALPMLYLLATCAGFLFSQINAPLPWMIGPLFATAVLTATGLSTVRVSTRTRPFGQIVVATFVGSHFTPEALHSLLRTAPLLISVGLFVLLAAMLVAQIQRRIYGTDPVSALLAVVPTSPVEASVLAERFGVPHGPIVLAQTARIALVVAVIPFLLHLGSDEQGVLSEVLPRRDGLAGIAVTLAGALLGPVIFRVLKFANPFFLGPLFLIAALSALDFPAYDIPAPLLAAAQIVLGTWLGSSFRPELLEQRNRLIGQILLSSTLLLVACILGAKALSWLFGAPFATVLMGIAPGGVTEMALTAGVLGQDVAMVTAMQLTRIFLIMPNLGWITRLTHRRKPPIKQPEAGE